MFAEWLKKEKEEADKEDSKKKQCGFCTTDCIQRKCLSFCGEPGDHPGTCTFNGGSPRNEICWWLVIDLIMEICGAKAITNSLSKKEANDIAEYRKVNRSFKGHVEFKLGSFLSPNPVSPCTKLQLYFHKKTIESFSFVFGCIGTKFCQLFGEESARLIITWYVYNEAQWEALGKMSPFWYLTRYKFPGTKTMEEKQGIAIIWKGPGWEERNATKKEIQIILN